MAEAEILPQTALSDAQRVLVLDAIELHDCRDPRPVATPEALLLREADFLDFLGVIGIAREFAWGPNDLPRCYERIVARRDALRGRFTLPKAQAIAEQRFATMQATLDLLVDEALGEL